MGNPQKQNVVAAVDYGFEENFFSPLEEEFEALTSYNTCVMEQKRRYRKGVRHSSNWAYDEHKEPNTTIQ